MMSETAACSDEDSDSDDDNLCWNCLQVKYGAFVRDAGYNARVH